MQVQLALVSLVGAGIAATLYGFSRVGFVSQLPWSGSGGANFVAVLSILAIALLAFRRMAKAGWATAGLVLAAAIAAIAGDPWAFLVNIVIGLASVVLGNRIRAAMAGTEPSTDWILDFLIGIGSFATLIGLMAHFPISYSWTYWLMLAGPAVAYRRRLLDIGQRLGRDVISRARELEHHPLASGVVIVLALVHVVAAFFPEVGHDALATHLFIPVQMAARHEWGFSAETYVWAVMPALVDWAFSLANMLGGEFALRLMNVGFVLVLAMQVHRIARWIAPNDHSPLLAMALFLSAPLTFTEGSSLFVEAMWAAFVVAGVSAIGQLEGKAGDRRGALVEIALLTGFACASKAVTLSLVPAMLLYLAWRWRAWWGVGHLREIAAGIVAVLSTGMIPYATAYLKTGNPVFPFFNGIFKSPLFPPDNFTNPLFSSGWSWDTLYRMTFQSGKYLEATIGAPGFHWLILLPAAALGLVLARHRRGLEVVVVGVLMILLVFQQTSYLRYVFPAFAILTACLPAAAIGAWPGVRAAVVAAAGGSIVLNLFFFSSAAFYRDFPTHTLVSEVEKRRYVEGRAPMRAAASFANTLVKPGQAVGVLGPALVAGLEVDALHSSWYNFRFEASISKAQSAGELAAELANHRVEIVLLDVDWGTKRLRALVESVTRPLATFGSVSVRVLRPELRYSTELLRNAEFSDIDGWQLPPEAFHHQREGALVTSITAPVVQVVAVRGGGRYLNSLRARCEAGEAKGRMQVNWHDASGKFIDASIRVFECSSEWHEHAQELVAPARAAFAHVYATSHETAPVRFDWVSLKQ